jgi:hypothetical protein
MRNRYGTGVVYLYGGRVPKVLLLQSFLALGLVVAGFGVFLLLRWADRLETSGARPPAPAASVHPFTPRPHASEGPRRAAA